LELPDDDTKHQTIDDLKVSLEPFKKLWDLQVDFDEKRKQWTLGAIKTLVPDDVEQDFRKFRSTSAQLIALFEGKRNPSMPKPAAMAKKINDETMKLKDHVPLIRAFCNPGLSARHVEKIIYLLSLQEGTDIKEINMRDLDHMQNLFKNKAEIEEISDRGSKEFGFSNTM
jgi:dynein heavy chain